MITNFVNTNALHYVEKMKSELSGKELFAHVITFGCQQNEADSERILGTLLSMGYKKCKDPLDADVVIVNTCAIREHAEMKALSLLGSFKANKKKNPDFILGICGCMANESHIADKLKKDFHYVSFTLEPGRYELIPELIYKAYTDKKRSFIYGTEIPDIVEDIPVHRISPFKAWVSIMYGCNNFCTYCIVPYVRGRERSRCSADVISECRDLVASGIKEITLLGQNVNSYRSDMTFPELLEKIAEIDGDFIIRFMTSHPKDTSEALINVMAKHTPKIAPFFHLPLQSGSDSVLKRMNRTYTKEKYLGIANMLREKIPGIVLSTDVIVGFPGESEDDFLDTLDVIEKVRFDNVYAFIYSEREGTRAATMDNKIDKSIRHERLDRLLEIQDKIALERNLPYEGEVVSVLVDSSDERKGKKIYNGRTSGGKLVHFTSDKECIGELVNVKINKANAFDLIGEII